MNTRCSPRQLAVDLQNRSSCSNVRVGAVIVDKKDKIFAWGWNSSGNDGLGLCAERHAISRANIKRLRGATVFVAGRRVKNNKNVPSRPCDRCMSVLKSFGIKRVEYITASGHWEKTDI